MLVSNDGLILLNSYGSNGTGTEVQNLLKKTRIQLLCNFGFYMQYLLAGNIGGNVFVVSELVLVARAPITKIWEGAAIFLYFFFFLNKDIPRRSS